MIEGADFGADGAGEPEFKRLTADEVAALKKASPEMSRWLIVGLQALVGVVVALVAWAVTGSGVSGGSAAYGALAVVLPSLVFVRGLARQQRAPNAAAALGGFFVWELVKVALTVVMLFAAPKLILELDWLALLAGFVVTMKVYWVAMWLHSARHKSVAKV